MNTDNLIQTIIELPRQFYKSGDKSIRTLLKESGYFETFDKITENNIANKLQASIEIINDWILWSENKRSSSGWAFFESNNKHYIVEYISNGTKSDTHEYSDKRIAYAAFIKREIESIRLS